MSEIRQAIRVSTSVVSALAVVAGLGGLMLSSCGKDDDKTTAATPTPSVSPAATALTYADVKSIIDAKCATCHTATPGTTYKISLHTEAAVKTNAAESLKRIALAGSNSLAMPPPAAATDPAYDTTTDGKKLKEYLSGL
jgi:uncharacterized membrane protein